MKRNSLAEYAGAMAFALEATAAPRELTTERINLWVEPPGRRPDLAGRIYLEAYEKVAGGIVFLNWWAPANRAGVRDFFVALAERKIVSPRPYRLGQACDGTIGSPVLHAFRVACDALGLDADALYREAYAERDEEPPAWSECRRHAVWQGGVVWPERWDAAPIAGLEASLTAINYHSLRSAFAEAVQSRGKR